MDVRGYARLHSQGGRREYRDPHETNPNPKPVSTLAASPAPPTPAHGAACHLPESASPTRSGRCHQTPPASPLPASLAALISCPSTAACPTSLGRAAQPPPRSDSGSNLQEARMCPQPGEPDTRLHGAPASPQVPPSPVRPSPGPVGLHGASRPLPERLT